MRLSSVVLGSALAAVALASPVQAALIYTENFNNGGSDIEITPGWSDTTNNIRYIGNDNLTFSNASYSNTANAGTGLAGTAGTASSPRGIQDSLGGTYSGELWFSYLYRPTAAGTTSNIMGLALNSITYAIGSPGGDSFGLGYDGSNGLAPVIRDASAGANTYGSDTSFAINNTYLLVAKVVVNTTVAANNDSLSLWVFKTSDTFSVSEAGLGTPDVTTNAADFGTGFLNIWLGRINSSSTHPTGRFDAIRISNASGDTGVSDVLGIALVPEPASLAVLGLGAVALLARRSGRRR